MPTAPSADVKIRYRKLTATKSITPNKFDVAVEVVVSVDGVLINSIAYNTVDDTALISEWLADTLEEKRLEYVAT